MSQKKGKKYTVVLDLDVPPTSSAVKVSTDRSMAVPWARRCPQLWQTSASKEVESRALITFKGIAPNHWLRYMANTWVNEQGEVEALTENIYAVDKNIKFTQEDWTVFPSWTVKYTLKKTEASTLRCAENLHTQISTCCLSLLTHWSKSWGSSEP